MTFSFIVVIFLIGFIGSFISGMIGIGGSIIKYPMLLYIPAYFGLMTFTAHEVAGISAIQVFFATLAGVFAYKNSGYLHKKLILYMGSGILLGSLLGGYGSKFLTELQINIIYAILATVAVAMMFMPKKEVPFVRGSTLKFNGPLAATLAFITGTAAGIVGAAGAFILVPIMLVILKIPTRITIATSLAITFISSIGATFGKIITGQILYGPALIMIIASLIAAPLGAKIGQKTNTKILKWMLAILILATATKIWLEIL